MSGWGRERMAGRGWRSAEGCRRHWSRQSSLPAGGWTSAAVPTRALRGSAPSTPVSSAVAPAGAGRPSRSRNAGLSHRATIRAAVYMREVERSATGGDS